MKSIKKASPQASRPYMPGYDMMFESRRKSLPWSWASKRLLTAHNYWLATIGPNTKPHVMPIWGVWLDDNFYFSTGRRSRKSRNLTASPRCTVCPENASEAVILEGNAREVTSSAILRKFAVAYKKKYDWDMGDLSKSRDPIYSVEPSVVFGFVEDSSKTRGNPTRWRLKGSAA